MRKFPLAALVLALTALFALPLAAADLPVDEAPVVDVEEVADTVQAETEPDAETADFDLDAVMDDSRIAMSCNFMQCREYCLYHYGEGVQWNCEGWDPWNQTCVCYP